MSRDSKKKRNKHSKMRHGNPKIGLDSHIRSTKRKIYRSIEKRLRKRRRDENPCTICINTSHGSRKTLKCGHVFHRKCVNQWLKNQTGNCPNCRKDVLGNTGSRQQSNPEIRPESSTNHRPLLISIPIRVIESRSQLRPIQNLDNLNTDLDITSPNLDNLSINLDDTISNMNNQSTDLDNPSLNLNNITTDSDNQSNIGNSVIESDDGSSDIDNLIIDTDDGSSDIDNSSIDSVNSLPNLDNSNADTPDSWQNLDIPARTLPRSFRNLDNPNVELPVLFVPVLCCGCQVDSNAQSEERSSESNVNNRSRRVLWDDEELHRQLRILRILLEDRDFTLNVLNSPAEPDKDLELNRHRRYISR